MSKDGDQNVWQPQGCSHGFGQIWYLRRSKVHRLGPKLECPNFGARPGLLHPSSKEVLPVWVSRFLRQSAQRRASFRVINNTNDANLKTGSLSCSTLPDRLTVQLVLSTSNLPNVTNVRLMPLEFSGNGARMATRMGSSRTDPL